LRSATTPPALALRGIAMAQLGESRQGKSASQGAARAFGPKEAVAARDVSSPKLRLRSPRANWLAHEALEAARTTLEAHGDRANAAHARYLQAGDSFDRRVDDAERTLATLDATRFPPAWRTTHELIAAGIEMRRLRTQAAARALARATEAAIDARVPR